MFRIISNKCSSTRRWIPKFVRHKTKTTNLCEVKPGERIHGYTVQKVVPVPELYLTAVSLTHDKTGAHHLHVSREDTDNVFGVAFRTTPRDDTGVPHILEHTVLCGSQKYPVRDPFFKMLNRSLSTFMNAFTASDWTMYPFSSQNLQDYKNLMSVYLDAAFFPKLTEMDFRQEGWRLEHENIEDPTSPIIFKGIVFNEMKGVFSNSQNLFSQKAQNLLLPSHTYSTCSGGDPHSIPQLTWENLKNFHASHYHPSNSRFFTYGNFPLENHLEFIDKHALSKFSQIDPKTSVPLETKWNEKREAEIQCNPDPMCADPNKQTTVAVSYLLGDVTDPFETTMLSVLGYLLVGGEKSPFYQALIEANIGSDYAPEIGFDQSARNGRFSVGLQGIHQDDVEKVKTIIEETVDKIIKDGFERRELEAIFHKVELNRRHQSSKFGLQVGVNLMYSWIHDADPSEFLQSKKHIDDLKNHIKENPRYLQEKVQNYLKDNPHKLTLVMHANDKFEEKRQNEESILLQNMVSKLSAQDKETVYQKGIELAKIQSEDEDLSCLPTLKVSDIDPVAKTVEIQSVHVDGTPIQLCPQPTNGVTYFRALSSIADLPEDLKPYVPLFCSVVTKMGAGEMNFRELAQKINLKTGGLNVGTHVTSHHSDENLLEQSIMFSSYCLEENFTDMFQLWSDIFHSLNLSDSGRLKMLILMSAAELANSITGIGHSYAMSHAASSLSPASHYKEVFGGMSQVSLMKKVAELSDLTHVIQSLNDIARHSLNRHTMRCSINATPESISDACQKTEEFVKQLYHPNQEKKEKLDLKHLHFYNQEPNFTCKPHDTHFKLPFQVNYMARSVKTVPFTNPDFASLRVLSKLMTSKFLHREIREKGGAYGGGASGGEPGLFNFYSYRDPNSSNTLDAFDRAVKWACEGSYSTQDIDEAKLGIFQQVDMPVSPGEEGMRQFFFDINDSMRQSHREQLFDVNKASLINVAEKYLTEDKRVSSVAFLGPENPLSSDQKSWTVKN